MTELLSGSCSTFTSFLSRFHFQGCSWSEAVFLFFLFWADIRLSGIVGAVYLDAAWYVWLPGNPPAGYPDIFHCAGTLPHFSHITVAIFWQIAQDAETWAEQ